MAVFLIWPNVYVLTASILPTALAIPSTDSVVHGYRIAMTPDRLLGRAESVRSLISLLIAPLGPLIAGVLLSTASARATIAVFAATGLVLAVWGTLSSSIRAAPSLDELHNSRNAEVLRSKGTGYGWGNLAECENDPREGGRQVPHGVHEHGERECVGVTDAEIAKCCHPSH